MQLAQYGRQLDEPMMYANHHTDNWVGALIGLVFLIVMVGLAVYVVRALTNNNAAKTATRDPLEIAKERYAKGEITKDELVEIKKELR